MVEDEKSVEEVVTEAAGNREEKSDVITVEGERGVEVERNNTKVEGSNRDEKEEGGVKKSENEAGEGKSEIEEVSENEKEEDDVKNTEKGENESEEEESNSNEKEKNGDENNENKEEEEKEENKDNEKNDQNDQEDTIKTENNQEIKPSPSISPNKPTPSLRSNTTYSYSRRPRRSGTRNVYNDIYQNTRNRYRQAVEGEGRFIQYHKIKYYEGSHLDTTPRNRSAIPSTDTFDFTVISQTTSFLFSPLTPSKERLFFFPYLLQRWKGLLFHSPLIHSPMSIAIMVNVTDVEEVETFIQSGDFPSRLRLALYITGFPKKTDCVYRRTSRGFRCVPATVYPLNRLRNIAIRNSLTSHFVVFDMDMWPASLPFVFVSSPEHTYDTLRALSPAYLENPFAVTIIPAFSLPSSLLESARCRSFKSCVTAIATRLPETKQQLVRCMRKQGCTIFRPKSLTHVGIVSRCYYRIICRETGRRFRRRRKSRS